MSKLFMNGLGTHFCFLQPASQLNRATHIQAKAKLERVIVILLAAWYEDTRDHSSDSVGAFRASSAAEQLS